MMIALAKESGHSELPFVPVVPIGHSVAGSYPWNFAAWNPPQTLAATSLSGQWPFWKHSDQPDWGPRAINGVPDPGQSLLLSFDVENSFKRLLATLP